MIYLIIVSLLWAPSFGLVPYVSGLGADFVAAARIVLSLLVFLPFIRPRGLHAGQVWMLAGLGALQFGFMYVLYIRSFAYLHPAQVALFTIFTPLLVTLFDDLLERRMSWIFLVTASLATIGTGICQYKGWAEGKLVTGFLLMQLSNGCFALGQVLYRRVTPTLGKKDHEIMGFLYAGAAAVACITAAGSVDPGKLAAASSTQITVLLYLGMIASGVGFFLFNAGARKVNVGTLAIFNNVKVPLAILCSAIVFGDRSINWPRLIAGGVLIGLALWLNERLVRARTAESLPSVQRA